MEDEIIKSLSRLKRLFRENEKSYTVEFITKISKKTKLNEFDKKVIDLLKQLKILIGENETNNFWNNFSNVISNKTWSPEKDNCKDLDILKSEKYLDLKKARTWFLTNTTKKKNKDKTYYNSLISLLPKDVVEKTKPESLIRPRKIKLTPNKELKIKLIKYFNVYRYVYNQCVAEHRKDEVKNLSPILLSIILSDRIISTTKETQREEFKWLNEYPYYVKYGAIREFITNIKSNRTKYKRTGKLYSMKFKSLKDEKQRYISIEVPRRLWNKGHFYSSDIRISQLTNREIQLKHDAKIQKSSTGSFYLIVLETKKDILRNKKASIFIDPGSKTFLTGYSPNKNIVLNIGARNCKIDYLIKIKNKLNSKIDLTKNKRKKKSLNKAKKRLEKRVRNCVSYLHYKSAKILCDNFNTIYIPKMNFHTMKNLRKLHKQKLQSLSHCYFVNLLKYKAEMYGETCTIKEVQENYTTRTCSVCGFMYDVGRSRIYKCNECFSILDRDINAGKNIMIKYFTDLLKKVILF